MTMEGVVVLILLVALAASPMTGAQATGVDMEYAAATGNDRNYPLDLTGRITKPTCVDIPPELSLCQNIGYGQMRMPNLLDHDTLDEVMHQSRIWIMLILQRCHEGTQLFLCTLFAPVCLDRPIYPCRSLCEEVRSGCGPLMESNCFPWPDMLDCDKFPPDNDLCIKSNMMDQNMTEPANGFDISTVMTEAYMTLFTQCHNDSTEETIMNKFCSSDFVLKMKIKTIRESKDGKKYIGDTNEDKLEVIKQGSLKTKDLKRLTFYVREGANCQCDMLEHSGNYLLVMGHRDNKKNRKLFMTFVHSWEKSRDFRRALKLFKDPDVCANMEAAELADGGSRRGENSRRERGEGGDNAAPMEQETPQEMTQAGALTAANDGVSTQVMSDGTPQPTRRNPESKRDSKRGGRRNRDRERQRKSRNRENREIPVRRAQSG